MKQKIRIWHIPQVPMDAFYTEVENFVEAKLLLDTIAQYDEFQLLNNIKPDYSSVGGLQVFNEEENDWLDWHPDDTEGFEEAVKSIAPTIYENFISDDWFNRLSLQQVRDIVKEVVKWEQALKF